MLAVGIFGVNPPAQGLLYGDHSARQLVGQLVGASVLIVWTTVASLVTFWVTGRIVGLRVTSKVELMGMDYSEHGGGAYPEFQQPSRPPSGTVAVVQFSIHGAAELWEWRPELMERATKALEAATVRAAVAHSGYVIAPRPLDDEPGQLVFAEPAAAFAWACDLTQRLLDTRWSVSVVVVLFVLVRWCCVFVVLAPGPRCIRRAAPFQPGRRWVVVDNSVLFAAIVVVVRLVELCRFGVVVLGLFAAGPPRCSSTRTRAS